MAEIYINGEKIVETDITKVDIDEELEIREKLKKELEGLVLKTKIGEGILEKPTFIVTVPFLPRKENKIEEEYRKRYR